MKENRLSKFVVLQVAFLVITLTIFPLRAASDALDLIENDIQSWRLEDARARLDKLSEEIKALPKALYLAGQLLFFEGNMDEALVSLRRAVEGNRAEMGWKALRDRVEETKRAFADTTTEPGKSKRFVYRFNPSFDALLVPDADDALTRQLTVLTTLFGNSPKRPVEVAFLPDADSLAAASGLLAEQIERTGTVGVTKFGRIMIITPRNLIAGYPWLDTLAHELTHFIITRASRDRIPIWLHEGISKLLECRWQYEKMQDLSPEEAYLLDRAIKEGRLIPLRRFHPSVAFLPDQEDAALAYAEVLSFLRFMDERMPKDWMKRLVSGIANGTPMDAILKSLVGADLQRLYGWWRKAASGKRHTPVPAVGIMKKRFKHGKMTSADADESLHELEVRKHLRVGDLLRLRGHLKGAVEEFETAREIAQFPSPEISDRLGACLLELGEFKRALALIKPMTDLYPSHAAGFIQLARAYVGLNETGKSIAALKQADAVNPFDPEVHCMAAGLYREIGAEDAAVLETEQCRTAVAVEKRGEEN